MSELSDFINDHRLHVDPPFEGFDKWSAMGDLRKPHSDWDDDNYRYTDAVAAKATAEGLTFETDPETCCSYFYCADEATARRLAAIAEEVVPGIWAQLQ